MAHEFLSTYRSDHLAGAQAALEILTLLRRDDDSESWRAIEGEIREDRAELERLMNSTGSVQSTVRRAAAWTAEKIAEFKLRVDDPSTSGSFRRLELIEALAIGIDGKQALWRALEGTSDSTAALRSMDYGRLIARAQAQRCMVEGQRLAVGPRLSIDTALDEAYYLFFREELRRGTFAPFFRASLRPMAIACFRLFTLRLDPLLSVPFFLRCIADFTRLPADLPYLAMTKAHAKVVLCQALVHDMLGDWRVRHGRATCHFAEFYPTAAV